MPTYDYRCPTCGHTEEIRHGVNDIGVFICPDCTDETTGPVTYLKKLITAPGIVFKGSGFYRTDSRPAPPKPKKETTSD